MRSPFGGEPFWNVGAFSRNRIPCCGCLWDGIDSFLFLREAVFLLSPLAVARNFRGMCANWQALLFLIDDALFGFLAGHRVFPFAAAMVFRVMAQRHEWNVEYSF